MQKWKPWTVYKLHTYFDSTMPIKNIRTSVMYNIINNFLAENNILSIKQYGFRGNYSTYMAMIDLVDKISSNIDHKKS